MKRVDLASPSPRKRERPYKEFRYTTEKKIYLPVPESPIDASIGELMSARRSRRNFQPISFDELAALLWHSARAVEVSSPSDSIRWQHRPTPSAGGRHPIDVLAIENAGDAPRISVYDPLSHSLALLRLRRTKDLSQFIERINDVVPVANATVLWFGAQFDRTLSKYQNGESLVWRDAGALIMSLYMAAEALSLACCAIGITGEPWLSKLLNSKKQVIGVGGALIGNR